MQIADCGLKIACEMKLADMIPDCELKNPRSEIPDSKRIADCENRNQNAEG